MQNNNLADLIIQFRHPKAKELNELEEQKRVAKINNDEIAYNYAQKNIEKIIRENQLSVLPEQWNLMSDEQQIEFVRLKIYESKILKDKDSFNYWMANLHSLENK